MRRKTRLAGVKRELRKLKRLTMQEAEEAEKLIRDALSGGEGDEEYNQGTVKI